MKVLITGAVAAGKSAVAKKLQGLGYTVYDTDSANLTRWENDRGQPVEQPDNPPKGWFEKNHWNLNIEELKKLLDREGYIFLCGITSNQAKYQAFFDKTILLKIDRNTLKKRIKSRTDNTFGKHPNELADILSWFDWFHEDLKKRGAVVINATQSLDKVVKQILAQLNGS